MRNIPKSFEQKINIFNKRIIKSQRIEAFFYSSDSNFLQNSLNTSFSVNFVILITISIFLEMINSSHGVEKFIKRIKIAFILKNIKLVSGKVIVPSKHLRVIGS